MSVPVPLNFGPRLEKIELWVAAAAFTAMLGVIVANVFLRLLLSQSLLWSEEIAYLGFNWATFAAVAWLYRTRGLIAVDAAFDLLPDAAQRVVGAAIDLMLVGANLWFAWLSWLLASGGFIRKTPVLQIPYFWINLAPLIAFTLMAAYSLCHVIRGLRGTAAPAQDGPLLPLDATGGPQVTR